MYYVHTFRYTFAKLYFMLTLYNNNLENARKQEAMLQNICVEFLLNLLEKKVPCYGWKMLRFYYCYLKSLRDFFLFYVRILSRLSKNNNSRAKKFFFYYYE